MKKNYVGIEEKEQNVYAKKVDDSIIHISEATSGRNGYFCMGCGGIMQAKIGSGKRVAHFSHEPKDVTRKGKCTYSDETYRHKLAKEILQRVKSIKLPAVYKFPPKDYDGTAVKIKDPETITVRKVGIEFYFFESDDGTINYTNSNKWLEDSNKFLLIKPDVTFFDSEDKPILLIEIVATHKVNADKVSKIRKLGIDTVQVTIPKDSAIEIENTFLKTERTKWIYNNEEAEYEYLRVPNRDAKGISPIDELQRELFEESFKCRASQINNFIRAIGKCLGSEFYRETELKLRGDIQRAEGNAERNRQRLGEIRNQLQKDIDPEFDQRNKDIRERRDQIKTRYFELEERYQRRKQEIIFEERGIRDTQNKYEPICQTEIRRIERELEQLGGVGKSIDERIRDIKREETLFEQKCRIEEDNIERRKSDLLREQFRIDERKSELPEEFRIKEKELESEFSRRAEEIRREFEVNRRRTIKEAEGRDITGISPFSGRIKDILDRRKILSAFQQAIFDNKRKRAAKQFFDDKSWKSWDRI